MPDIKEVLTKLGMALYVRKALRKRASAAREAVEYLGEMGLFGEDEDQAAQ